MGRPKPTQDETPAPKTPSSRKAGATEAKATVREAVSKGEAGPKKKTAAGPKKKTAAGKAGTKKKTAAGKAGPKKKTAAGKAGPKAETGGAMELPTTAEEIRARLASGALTDDLVEVAAFAGSVPARALLGASFRPPRLPFNREGTYWLRALRRRHGELPLLVVARAAARLAERFLERTPEVSRWLSDLVERSGVPLEGVDMARVHFALPSPGGSLASPTRWYGPISSIVYLVQTREPGEERLDAIHERLKALFSELPCWCTELEACAREVREWALGGGSPPAPPPPPPRPSGPRPYSMSERFRVGDEIVHPSFGAGTVQAVAGRAITVTFDDEERQLRHDS